MCSSKDCVASSKCSDFSAQNPLSDTLHGRFVIVDFHCFERAPQLVRQFGIELAHSERQLHTNRLNVCLSLSSVMGIYYHIINNTLLLSSVSLSFISNNLIYMPHRCRHHRFSCFLTRINKYSSNHSRCLVSARLGISGKLH